MFKLIYLFIALSKSDELFLENNQTSNVSHVKHVKHGSHMKILNFVYKIPVPNISHTYNRILYDGF